MLQSKLHQLELEKQDCTETLTATEKRIREISNQIAQNDDHRRKLEVICDQSRLSQEKEKLDSRRQALLEEQNRLNQGLQALAQQVQAEVLRLKSLCGKILEQEAEETLFACAESGPWRSGCLCVPCTRKWRAVFLICWNRLKNAQRAVAAFSGVLRNAQHKLDDRLAEWNEQRDQKNAALANLRKNIKDYPRGLLQLKKRLADELERQVGCRWPLIFWRMCWKLPMNIGAARWRDTCTRRNFIFWWTQRITSRHCQFSIGSKKEFGPMSFGLVDVGKLRERETIRPRDDSLAKKVNTENQLARSYMDYLLGRVVCCETVEQLRNFKTAITEDGMLYQGYVARSMQRDRMENAFIGHYAVSLRISRLKKNGSRLKWNCTIGSPSGSFLNRKKNRCLRSSLCRTRLRKSRRPSALCRDCRRDCQGGCAALQNGFPVVGRTASCHQGPQR